MQQPRQQHYHFAYTALPSKIFAGRVPWMLLEAYPDTFVPLLHRLWEELGEQLPPAERAPVEGLKATAHRVGGKFVTLLVHMPPPERSLETYFVAVVFTPSVRYFTLGRGVSLPGMSAALDRPTFREVSAGGVNANRGSGPTPTADAFLRHLCRAFDLPDQVEDVPDADVRALAGVLWPAGSAAPPPGDQGRKKRWWEFWK